MKFRVIIPILVFVFVVAAAGLVLLTDTIGLDPAYAVAVDFANAAGQGADAQALALLAAPLREHVLERCPDASVSACIAAYTPSEWGGMLATVFRRAMPDGPDAFNIVLIATYERDQGFSGVCIYTRTERSAPPAGDAYGGWRVAAWSGFISCDLPEAGLSALMQPDAPNRAP